MTTAAHFRRLEALYHAARINAYYQPRLTIAEGRAELVIPLEPKFHHAMNAVHGSVYFKALDDAAYFAVNSLVTDVFVLTVSFNIQLLRPVVAGTLRAEGTVVRAGRELFFADAIAYDAGGQELARGSGVFARARQAIPAAGPDEGTIS